MVQIHHIDQDPTNNSLENLAVLCLQHHDLATMTAGLSAKLTAEEIRAYKRQWEWKCERDVEALARSRVNVFLAAYKNPPRIRQLLFLMPEAVRVKSVDALARQIASEEGLKASRVEYELPAIPGTNNWTAALLTSLKKGELWPSPIPRVGGHPRDPDYPDIRSYPDGMTAYHAFDLYCQLMVRVILLSVEVLSLDDVTNTWDEYSIAFLSGKLVTFSERIRGRGVKPPDEWSDTPTATLWFRKKSHGREFRAEMLIKTMYVFSDTASYALKDGRLFGIGIFQGKAETPKAAPSIRFRIVPLLLGVGHIPAGLFADLP